MDSSSILHCQCCGKKIEKGAIRKVVCALMNEGHFSRNGARFDVDWLTLNLKLSGETVPLYADSDVK